METILSELEVRVLKLVKENFRRKNIRKELALTYAGMQSIFNKLREGGFTKIHGYGGSGCTCSLNESNPSCECDGSPNIGRYTVISNKGKDYLNNIQGNI